MTINFDYMPAIRGDTIDALEVTLTWDETGDPVDLTGATIQATFRQCNADGPIVYQADTTAGVIVNSALGGIYTISEFIASFPSFGTYWFDNQVILSDGFVTTSVIGTIELTEDVTK